MAEYEIARKGKLVLKGEKEKSKRKHKKDKREKHEKKPKIVVDEDALSFGGFWKCAKIEEINGSVAIQFGERSFVKSLDNGLFCLGSPHGFGEGPSPEEILTGIVFNETKIVFKSGYGKYLKVEKDGVITGRSEAIGSQEQFDPVWENGKMALLCANGCFMAIDPEDDALVALKKKAGDNEVLQIRACSVREVVIDDRAAEEKEEDLSQVEINYVRKFQKFQDKKLKVTTEDKLVLEGAKKEGTLHESLLDRRSKMKADRYCK